MFNYKNKNWYYTFGLLVPLLAIYSPIFLWDKVQVNVRQPIKACIIGFIIAVVCYFLMKYVLVEKFPLKQSVLAGLLTAEVMTFAGGKYPNMAVVTLWLFFYFNAVLSPH